MSKDKFVEYVAESRFTEIKRLLKGINEHKIEFWVRDHMKKEEYRIQEDIGGLIYLLLEEFMGEP